MGQNAESSVERSGRQRQLVQRTGQGYIWSPYDAANAGFDPYGIGNWMWTPGFGYIWASGYPWGYMPFQCGAGTSTTALDGDGRREWADVRPGGEWDSTADRTTDMFLRDIDRSLGRSFRGIRSRDIRFRLSQSIIQCPWATVRFRRETSTDLRLLPVTVSVRCSPCRISQATTILQQ